MIPAAYRNPATSRFEPVTERRHPRQSDLTICLILSVAIVSLLLTAL